MLEAEDPNNTGKGGLAYSGFPWLLRTSNVTYATGAGEVAVAKVCRGEPCGSKANAPSLKGAASEGDTKPHAFKKGQVEPAAGQKKT
jgi:hypothetical protein